MQMFHRWLKILIVGISVFASMGRTAHASAHPDLDGLFGALFSMMDRCLGYCHLDFDQDFTLIEVSQGFEPEVIGRDRIILELDETIEFLLSVMDEVAPEDSDTYKKTISAHYHKAVAQFSNILGNGAYRFYRNHRSFRNGYARRQLYFVGDHYRIKIEYGSGR